MNYKSPLWVLSLLLLTACGHSTKHGETTPGPDNADYSDTFVYDANSPYKKVLKVCAGATKTNQSCSLEKLPFLAQEKTVPTKTMIMQRVVVSHQWMGDRFAKMLDVLDDDIKILLGATTAIVIDDDIIPSYYWGLTGAMYIDPRYLWLTPEEASTITKKEDYRAGFSNKLQFLTAGRSLINGKYASRTIYMEENISRTIEDIKLPLASLLYHELAHANDYYPPYLRKQINSQDSVLEALNSVYSENISHKLYENSPLSSELLLEMGQVMFHGEEATTEQQKTTATTMGEHFQSENGVRMYAYSSEFEDTATLFQNAMMKLHYNVEEDFAFLETPSKTEDLRCADYIVGWGERNTVAKEEVQKRALFVTKRIFPNIKNLDAIFKNNLGKAQLLKTQIDWCSALNIDGTSNKQFKLSHEKINPDDLKLAPL